MGSHSLLQGIFLTWELYSSLLHCRQIHYRVSHQENPTSASVPEGYPVMSSNTFSISLMPFPFACYMAAFASLPKIPLRQSCSPLPFCLSALPYFLFSITKARESCAKWSALLGRRGGKKLRSSKPGLFVANWCRVMGGVGEQLGACWEYASIHNLHSISYA